MTHRLVLPRADRPTGALPEVEPGDPLDFHRTLEEYHPTPLLRLPSLARRLGVAQVLVKDEAERLGLPAFKMLGASWATARAVRRHWTGPDVPLDVPRQRAALADGTERRLVAATDGNHGRGVARMAAMLGVGCTIYVPAGMAPSRQSAIEGEGATVNVVEGSYDDAVRRSAQDLDDRTLVISDTSWPGYATVPADVVHGYSTIFREVDDALRSTRSTGPTHVFLQAGVGSFAAAGLLHHAGPSPRPVGIVVEPSGADCLLRSAAAGHVAEAPGPHTSSMAGLNCGLPSLLAWPVVDALADVFVAVDDDLAHEAMRLLAGAGIVSGESGAAGLAGLLALSQDDASRSAARLGPDAVVLLVNTEGATDPDNFGRQVGERPVDVAAAARARQAAAEVEVVG